MMGGTGSVEFMVPSPAGEDDIARCGGCGYAANVERATSTLAPVDDGDTSADLARFPTPGVRTIAALETVEGGAPAHRQIKTMVMVLDGAMTLALVRGDHQLNLQKLADGTRAVDIRPAEPVETLKRLGAHPGSLGAVGVDDLRIVADHALRGRRQSRHRRQRGRLALLRAWTSTATSPWTSGSTSGRCRPASRA